MEPAPLAAALMVLGLFLAASIKSFKVCSAFKHTDNLLRRHVQSYDLVFNHSDPLFVVLEGLNESTGLPDGVAHLEESCRAEDATHSCRDARSQRESRHYKPLWAATKIVIVGLDRDEDTAHVLPLTVDQADTSVGGAVERHGFLLHGSVLRGFGDVPEHPDHVLPHGDVFVDLGEVDVQSQVAKGSHSRHKSSFLEDVDMLKRVDRNW